VFLRISIIISISFIGFNQTFSQEKENSFYVSCGVENIKIKDNFFSPTTYKGIPFCAAVEFISETPAYKDGLSFLFQTGNIQSTNGNAAKGSETKLVGGHIIWEHIRNLNTFSATRSSFYLGGVLNSSFTRYKRNYYGDDSYYLYQSSLGPSFTFIHPFSFLSMGLFFENQIDFALLAYSIYPSYCSPMPDRLLKKDLNDISITDYMTGGKIHTINKFQRINYMAGILYDLNSKIALKLSYNWELINIMRQENLTMVNHDFFISLIVK
jgi:hypothetical protein